MEKDRLRQILEWFAQSDLLHFELQEGEDHLRLTRAEGVSPSPALADPVQTPLSPATSSTDGAVPAPLYGVCYLSPEPGAPPYVIPGKRVARGDTLCVLEAMKVLNPILAPRDGIVGEIFVNDGSEVEEGAPLMALA
ncbi:MAG: acetyl-CoA carboxylase biotin carboxyl carrier protein [Pseudorhodobacter sp.]